MEIDAKILEKIKNMDLDELSRKIEEVSKSIGVDPRMVKMIAGDPEGLSKKLERINPEDLRRISAKLDREKLEKLKKQL